MRRRTALLLALLAGLVCPAHAEDRSGASKLDAELRDRAAMAHGRSRVIVQASKSVYRLIESLGGRPGRPLSGIDALVAEIPNASLDRLAASEDVRSVSADRPVHGTMERTSAAIGASFVRDQLGFDGRGIGVAIIDSGVTAWHDDLGSERVVHFADFVGFQRTAYDDYGHGTHVAGIIAGDGYDSGGARTGVAPGANLVVLKVLDGEGNGYISNVIAAVDYAIARRADFNIRVINLSVAAAVRESFTTDPLTLAARRAVEAGIVVVTAAGNYGRNLKGQPQNGGVTAPGNAPWVLTVGASSDNGTATRADDVVAAFSSRGPTYIDYAAKPDLVAPGVRIESLADPSSQLFADNPGSRLWGTVDTAAEPYLSLSGTSMAAPVVAGTVALMLQANRGLTPNLVKAILQFTAEDHRRRYDTLTEGAGFLNARGAVLLAQAFAEGAAAPPKDADPTRWSHQIIWGNQRMTGSVLKPDSTFWRADVMWGMPTTNRGDNVVLGALGEFDDADWDAACLGDDCAAFWGGRVDAANVVWGSACGGADCVGVIWAAGCAGADASCSQPWTGLGAGSGSLSGVIGQSCDSSGGLCDDAAGWRDRWSLVVPTVRARAGRESR
jgi:serine protease AprX